MSWYNYRGRCLGRVLHFVEHYCGLHLAEHVTVGADTVTDRGKPLASYTWSTGFGDFDVPEFTFAPCSETYVYKQRTKRESAILDGCATEPPPIDKRRALPLEVLRVLRGNSAYMLDFFAQIIHSTSPACFLADDHCFADVAGRIYQLDAGSGEWMLWYVPNRYQEMERSLVRLTTQEARP